MTNYGTRRKPRFERIPRSYGMAVTSRQGNSGKIPQAYQRGGRKSRKQSKVLICYRPVCPSQIIVPLKYVSEKLNIVCTSGASNYHLFNFNNLYDPDRTGTGHQPCGFDEWTAFYSIYRVLSASIDIWATNTTNSNPIRLVLQSMGSTGGSTNADLAQEQRGKEKFGGDQTKVLHIGMKRKGHQVFNVTKEQYRSDDLYRAATSGAPSKEGCFQIWAQPFDELTTSSISFKAEIVYNVIFSNPKFIAQS